MTSPAIVTPDTDEPVEFSTAPVDFWGASEEKIFYFPGQEKVADKFKQYIEFKSMDEGARHRFQKATNHSITIEKTSQNAKMGVDPAGDRWALIKASVTGWKLFRGGEELPFKPHLLDEWMRVANPAIIDDLERRIREANPWMLAEMSLEAIDQEIDNLTMRRAEAVARQEAEESFGTK